MFLLAPHALLRGAEISLTAPQNFQVAQRTSKVNGTVRIAGELSETPPIDILFKARLLSFIPIFGDALAEKFDVPIGIVACGIGATSVREWLPKGSTFPNPPTIENRVTKLPSGEWESNGDAFAQFVTKMISLGPNGFRAVLWHQGESDALKGDLREREGKAFILARRDSMSMVKNGQRKSVLGLKVNCNSRFRLSRSGRYANTIRGHSITMSQITFVLLVRWR